MDLVRETTMQDGGASRGVFGRTDGMPLSRSFHRKGGSHGSSYWRGNDVF